MTTATPDPTPLDWSSIELPETWPDRLNFWNPAAWATFAAHVLGLQRSRVEIPDAMPGTGVIPKYVLLEFHNLPNGNYSHRVTKGYSAGFDRAMLGELAEGRRRIAEYLGGCRSVLDVGCGAGATAAAVREAGVPEVWGIDPSPYLLQHAARQFPRIRWVQGVAERTGFANERFDGIGVCFVFHELPPRYADRALAEFARILRPGGRLIFVEPSAVQMRLGLWTLLRRHGWRGPYFKALARLVYEPFVAAWHERDIPAWLREHGFEPDGDDEGCPLRIMSARKRT